MLKNCSPRSIFWRSASSQRFGRSDDNSTPGSDVVYVIECHSVHSAIASRMSSNLSGVSGRTGWSTRDVVYVIESLLTGLIRELRKQLFLSQLVCLFWPQALTRFEIVCCLWPQVPTCSRACFSIGLQSIVCVSLLTANADAHNIEMIVLNVVFLRNISSSEHIILDKVVCYHFEPIILRV